MTKPRIYDPVQILKSFVNKKMKSEKGNTFSHFYGFTKTCSSNSSLHCHHFLQIPIDLVRIHFYRTMNKAGVG